MSKSKHCEAVRVVVRCRPFNRKEETAQCENILDIDDKLGRITIRNPKAPPDEPMKVFTFDSVYGWESKQSDIYDDAVRPLVESVLHGFNGTIFAYGQTGTGKTFTMQGVSNDPDKRGVIPNSFQHIFTQISRTQNQKYLVRSSYLEIYQEEVRDLLCKDNNKKLELKENPDFGVYVKDLSSVVTKNATEIEHVMNIGNQSRSVGFTNMNEHSSRSHAIFVVTVECSEVGPDGEDHIRVGKLNMVDLAGSERQSKTGAKGKRMKEATKINLSLSALGNVISALADGKSTHIPYRDSKLTRLLQDSLGGNAKTVMIATVGPSQKNFSESLATLRYASRAKNIKNKPRINEDPKDALLREFQQEIARLKAQLEEQGMLAKERRRRRNSRRLSKSMAGMEEELLKEKDVEDWKAVQEESDLKQYMKEGGIPKSLTCQGSSEKLKPLNEHRKSVEDMQWDQDALEKIIEKYKTMESKLLVGGKTIIDHTNEQQKMLELKRQEIAEQIRREREIQQQMMLQDEEALEMKETFSSLQQEVELKTKKLKRLYTKLQLVKGEIKDVIDEHVMTRQELEQTQNELTRELKYKYLLIENFIPPEEKNKIMNRLHFDSEEDQWRLQPVLPSESAPTQVKRRPLSAVGYKRPISQYAQMAVATATGAPSRYQAENIMLLELDMSPPTMFTLNLNGTHLERAFSPRLMRDLLVNVPTRERPTSSSRVRKSQSWYQAPQAASVTSSSSSTTLASGSQSFSPSHRQRPSSAAYLPLGGPVQTSP
ncbi:kinesin-like protein KIF3B [Seriola lalandi dorsalis]|uniref:Kinesin-like protein n=1 Tax=Seriola lalandi dorsalis TaxID=1841481 RepID=A0A3B4YFR6_SERLL|nr:kinesin-like protein KIF3B [Seriola lalandi dorsalis]XP_056249322.1 kinesin-like protein KIF3B [Seriola aureovittata]